MLGDIYGIVFLILISNVIYIQGILKTNKVACHLHDDTFFKIPLCRLKPVKRNVAEFSLHVVILKAPIRECTLHIEVLRKYTIYRPFFINSTIDACEFMRNRKKYPIASFLYDQIETFTNLNHTCPYEGDIFITKYAPDLRYGFIPLPPAEYLLKLDWIFKGKKRLTVDMWFLFDEEKN